jgi:hypothetical protein
MQIVWNKEAVEKLKNTHTVLELETFTIEGQDITTYCVVPPEKIGLTGFSTLEAYKEMHAAFVDAYKRRDEKLCRDVAPHLIGHFDGELDSFYTEILNRFES